MVDFADSDELRTWLNTQSKEVSVMIAARAALRVFPVTISFLEHISVNETEEVILPIFRAMAASWIVARYPQFDFRLKLYIHDAAVRAGSASAAASTYSPDISADAYKAAQAAEIAAETAVCTEYDGYAKDAVEAADCAYTTMAAVINDMVVAGNSSPVSFDATQILNGKSASEVAQLPLWPNGVPEELDKDWQEIKAKLLVIDEFWEVWTDWYEARLYSKRKSIKSLELARATIIGDIWKQGPRIVNAHIKELIEQHTKRSAEEMADLGQHLAPYEFYAKEGKILARPLEGHPYSPDMTEDMRTELKRKAHDLLTRLTSTQAPQRLLDTLGRLDEVLGDDLDAVKPGLLLSIARSLAADINAYDTTEGRAELAEDAFSHMTDVRTSLEDLKACYPEIAKLEAAALAQKMTGGMAEKFMEQSDEIIKAAEQNPETVSETALQGLKAMLPDIEALREKNSFETDDEQIIEAGEKLGRLVALHSLTLRNFTVSVLSEAKRTSIAYTRDFRKNADNATRAATIAGVVFLFANPVAAIAVLGLSAWAQLPKEIEKLKDDDQPVDPNDKEGTSQ